MYIYMDSVFDINKIRDINNNLIDEQVTLSNQLKLYRDLDNAKSEKMTKLLSKELNYIGKMIDMLSKVREIKMDFDNIDNVTEGKKKSFRSRS